MVTRVRYSYVRDDATGVWTMNSIPRARTKPPVIHRLTHNRTSIPNPKYKQIIEDEGNATTPLTADSQYLRIDQGSAMIEYTNPNQKLSDTHLNMPSYVMPLTSLNNANYPVLDKEAQAKATAQVYKSIAAFQTTFGGQVFTGELKEVLDLVRNPFKTSAKLTDTFLRTLSGEGLKLRQKGSLGRWSKRQLTELPKAVADQWLEYSFAVSPLIGDVADLITLATDLALKREHETVRGYGESVITQSKVYSPLTGQGLTPYVNQDVIIKSQNIIRSGMTAKFIDAMRNENSTNPWIDSIDDFSSIPVTAWELMPFSFLVDYFVNVQDILQSAIVSQSGIAYTSNSLIRTYEVTETLIDVKPTFVWIKNVSITKPRRFVSGVRSVNRTGTLLGIPPVVFSLPGSNTRYANIAALLTKLL